MVETGGDLLVHHLQSQSTQLIKLILSYLTSLTLWWVSLKAAYSKRCSDFTEHWSQVDHIDLEFSWNNPKMLYNVIKKKNGRCIEGYCGMLFRRNLNPSMLWNLNCCGLFSF
jgi:hypothetical protein